jgi:hypothetical protein
MSSMRPVVSAVSIFASQGFRHKITRILCHCRLIRPTKAHPFLRYYYNRCDGTSYVFNKGGEYQLELLEYSSENIYPHGSFNKPIPNPDQNQTRSRKSSLGPAKTVILFRSDRSAHEVQHLIFLLSINPTLRPRGLGLQDHDSKASPSTAS